MAIEGSYNFRHINAQVTTSGVVGAARLKKLIPEGYEAVINLLPDDSQYAVENEKQIIENQGIKYFHIPVEFDNPSLDNFEQFITAMDEVKQIKTHIHCAANYRVSAFYALYAQSKGLWSRSQAQGLIDGLWQPLDYPGWPEFIDQVSKQYITD